MLSGETMTGPLRTYTELSRLETFEDRYDYLRIGASVGVETFGYDRYLNQQFYHSAEWRRAREKVILRDQACDLGMLDREIFDKILVHHMNPMSREDILTGNETLCDPEFLITVSHATHNAIHYGDPSLIVPLVRERRPNDTIPWR